MNIYSWLIHCPTPAPTTNSFVLGLEYIPASHRDNQILTVTMPLLDADIERDLYSELGVSRQATKQEIHNSYRTLSLSRLFSVKPNTD